MEMTGVLFAAAAFLCALWTQAGYWHLGLITIAFLLYAFIRFCTSTRWYADVPRDAGIQLQFRKALVPVGYAMTICFGLYLLTGALLFPAICDFVLAVVAHVNVILLTFHRRDKDPTPVNFYSNGNFRNS